MSVQSDAYAGTINFGMDPKQEFLDNLIIYMKRNWDYSAWVGEYCKGGWMHLHIAVWNEKEKEKESFRRAVIRIAKKYQGNVNTKRAINVKQQYSNGWLEKYMCKDFVVNGNAPQGVWTYKPAPEKGLVQMNHPKVNHKLELQNRIKEKNIEEINSEINKYAYENGLVLPNRKIIAEDIWRANNELWEANSKEIERVEKAAMEKRSEEFRKSRLKGFCIY